MATRNIRLADGADPRKVLAAARAALEQRGYHWVPTGAGSAEAHRDGRAGGSTRMARHLRLGLTVVDGQLLLRRENSGWGWAVPLGSLIAMRIAREFRRAVRAVRAAERDARLGG